MESHTRPRRSTSAASYNDTEASPIRTALGELRILLSDQEDVEVVQETIRSCLQQTLILKDALGSTTKPCGAQDAFRALNGFRVVLDLAQYCTRLSEQDLADKANLDLLLSTITLLQDALHSHRVNRKYFARRINAGGWTSLDLSLSKYLAKGNDDGSTAAKLFGALLACSVEDNSLIELLENLKTVEDTQDTSENLFKIISSTIPRQTRIRNPEIFSELLLLWSDHARSQLPNLPLVLRAIYTMSTHNLIAVHEAGMLSRILELLKSGHFSAIQTSELQAGAVALLQLGISHLDDAQLLYGDASRLPQIANALDTALQASDGVPYIHFDMSLHGYSCIELPSLGRAFPPPSNVSSGYTLSVWFQVVSFDTDSHTTIFGAFDSSQTCFVLVYLEKDSQNLILQTSLTTSRPSVRFKSYDFKEGKWYHLCLVHKRPGMTSSSRASLYVDGEFVEQVKAHFPSHPPTSSATDTTSSHKPTPVQAFIGTPKDLALALEPGRSNSQWRLASACLFSEVLNDDLIAVYHELGPRYYGNYQDCLGSFQTYAASAALNLRNETLNAGKEDKSTIIMAIRSKAANLLPESNILLNLSPWTVIDEEYQLGTAQNLSMRALSRDALKNLRHWTNEGNTIAINAAIPSINKALVNTAGVAFLAGSPAVAITQAIDDATWRLGGCIAVGLSLVEAANTEQDLEQALDTFLASIKGSWRNSEAMERENGFSILGGILSTKFAKLGITTTIGDALHLEDYDDQDNKSILYKILLKILIFLGYDPDAPENSVINNPLAYRVLLVDLDIWRSAPVSAQRLYFEQFTIFCIGSKYHIFNAKRLSRMRITKKWISALKGDALYPKTLGYFLTAFKSLLNSSLTAEAHRSLAQYITYAVHKTKDKSTRYRTKPTMRPPPAFGPIVRRSTAPIVPDADMSPIISAAGTPLSRSEVGIEVFEMYGELLCQRDTTNIKKFAKTVTNKWLLHLMTEDDPRVVILSTKLLARVLTTNGPSYVDKFADKTNGFTIMQYRLKKWWSLPDIWMICLAILFDVDVALLKPATSIDLYGMLSKFPPTSVMIVYPAIMPVVLSMLQSGFRAVIQSQSNPESPSRNAGNGTHNRSKSNGEKPTARNRALSRQPPGSMGFIHDLGCAPEDVKVVQTISRFLSELQLHSKAFKTYTASSSYIQELLFLLFPLIVSSDVVSAETELHSRDSALTFDGQDVVIRPLSRTAQHQAPIVRTTSVEGASSPESTKAKPLKRGSSYILITSEEPRYAPSPARLEAIASPRRSKPVHINISHELVQEGLELVVAIFIDSILYRKDFNGLGMFLRVPPGFQEHQAYFQSFILRNTLSSLENQLKLNQNLLVEPRVLTNLQKLCTHLDEAVFEGWFIDGGEVVIDFLGEILEHLQRSDIKQIKSVRLCSEVINSLRAIIARVVLLRLSESDASQNEVQTVKLLRKLSYWQTVLFSAEVSQEEFLKLLCYLLYTKLITEHDAVREVTADLWRTLLVQKPQETAGVLHRIMGGEDSKIARGFQKILEVDNLSFLAWIDDHRTDLDAIFLGRLTGIWENFTAAENKMTESNYKSRILRRRERLKIWVNENNATEDVLRRHEIAADHWKANIYTTEHIKKQRALQDQQDGLAFNLAAWRNIQKDLDQPSGLLVTVDVPKSRLDMTEGRNRMRLRLLPDKEAQNHDYKPKRAMSKFKKSLEIRARSSSAASDIAPSPTLNGFRDTDKLHIESVPPQPSSDNEPDDDFEIVEEPDLENFEDKNRKVMRSLQRGDTVEYVHNISRIAGLEACEGLLIMGKQSFYIMDHYFQRSDGEIVDVWQAPPDERDHYMQMISGQSGTIGSTRSNETTHETRSWRWEDILSISKRRFLFRDVGIEVFFMDGESYLLTVATPKLRDDVYSKLMNKVQSIGGGLSSANPEDQWRVESLRSTEDSPQSLGAKFTNVFTQGTANPVTKKWLKGEISNFQYLMLVNTMAGRTFNDLTQYPVFPWVLADYTSEELDLTNPRSFRDLTKPMGAQSPQREAEFHERYLSFAEMGDANAPPFHYGTHYSTSMIVTGYLIRMQPFVQSYLLLQGGAFDHPDRLFYSIEKAWLSASRENMSDVRELIPEFFYLPEMFENINGYDFGKRQGNGEGIDNVVLPRWAKGDPNIFIAKHREALESEHVSRHLHQWIDLIFGHKQRGEAALESTNVFHHLSYRGAKDLDNMTDAKDREVTIKIIHNFGQTPHQVFHKAHPGKEVVGSPAKRLDNAAETLNRLPAPLLETKDKVSNLVYSTRQERILASGFAKLYIPPNYDRVMEWGFIDGSVRFYQAENHKLIGLFEHVHQSQVSNAIFADAKTLITCGMDCTISVWTLVSTSKSIDLVARGSLFGHRSPVTHLAVSKPFSSLASASSDGAVFLWDLNRLSLIRTIIPPNSSPSPTPTPPSSSMVQCLTISPTTGLTVIAHMTTTSIYTLNGHALITKQPTCPEQDECITSLALFTGNSGLGNGQSSSSLGSDYLSRDLLFTGHRHGVVNVWSLIVHDGKWMLEHIRRLNHVELSGANITASISAVLPAERGVWTGDEEGKVWEWTCTGHKN